MTVGRFPWYPGSSDTWGLQMRDAGRDEDMRGWRCHVPEEPWDRRGAGGPQGHGGGQQCQRWRRAAAGAAAAPGERICPNKPLLTPSSRLHGWMSWSCASPPTLPILLSF